MAQAPEGRRLVAIEKLQVGDHFIVKSGEKIPADGRIESGTAVLDENETLARRASLEQAANHPLAAAMVEASEERKLPRFAVREELNLVPEAIALSQRTACTIKQNLTWAFFYNLIGIAVAGWLDPLMAAAAMLSSSLSVIGTSMRLHEGHGQTFFPRCAGV